MSKVIHPNIVMSCEHTVDNVDVSDAAQVIENCILNTCASILHRSDDLRATFLRGIYSAIERLGRRHGESLFYRYTLASLLIRTAHKAFISTDVRLNGQPHQEWDELEDESELRQVVRTLDKQFRGVLEEGQERGKCLPMNQVRVMMRRCEMADFYPRSCWLVEEIGGVYVEGGR